MKRLMLMLALALIATAALAGPPIPLPPMGRVYPMGTNIVVSWDAPTLNEDGTALTNASSYRLYVAKKANPTVDNWSAFTMTNWYAWGVNTSAVMSLPRGCYTFYVTALNVDGNESDPSSMLYFQLYKTWPQAVTATIQGR